MPEDVEPYIPVLAGRFEGREDIPSWVASAFVGTQGCFVSIRKVKSGEMWNQIACEWASVGWTAKGASRRLHNLGTFVAVCRRPAGEPECGAGSAQPASQT